MVVVWWWCGVLSPDITVVGQDEALHDNRLMSAMAVTGGR